MDTEPTTKPNARDGVAASKEALVTDLKTAVADADHLLKEAAGATAREFAEARHTVARQVRCAAQATDGYVKGHPWTVLGVAAVAGLVIGSLLRPTER